MVEFRELNEYEQKIFEDIECFFINSNMQKDTFVKILGILINKYKFINNNKELFKAVSYEQSKKCQTLSKYQ